MNWRNRTSTTLFNPIFHKQHRRTEMKSYKTLCILSASIITLNFATQGQETTDAAAKKDTEETNAVVVVNTTDKNEALISMSFDETPVTDVIKAFRDATGANIILSGTNLTGIVSVRLDNVPWRQGLNSILDPQNLKLVEKPIGSGIYLVTTKTVEVEMVTKTFQLSNAQVTSVEELFLTVLGEKGKATAFPPSNTIIVTAPEKEIKECALIIEAIDRPAQQVYIEARFVEMSASAGKSLGVRWDDLGNAEGWGASFDGATLGYENNKTKNILKSNVGETTVDTDDGAGNTTSLTVPNIPAYRTGSETYDRNRTFTGSLSMDAFRLAINAFENTDGVSFFSNPKVIVANEEKAKIDMTRKEPNVEVDYQAATTEGQRDSVSTKLGIIPGEDEPFVGEAFFSYGIALNVIPRISSSGLVTVTIEPSISSLKEYYEVQGLDENMPASRYPVIDMRRIQTVFTMQSGRTAVIGGLTQTSDTNVENGIPLLKEIPWIGPRLFGWKSRQKIQKEVVIFVTVTIADPLTIKENEGMPRNAFLSKEILSGETKTPENMSRADILNLKDSADDTAKRQMEKAVKIDAAREAEKEAPEEITPVVIDPVETLSQEDAPVEATPAKIEPVAKKATVTEKAAATVLVEPILAN